MNQTNQPNEDTDIDNLVRDLTKVHPLPKSLVRSKIEALVQSETLKARIDEIGLTPITANSKNVFIFQKNRIELLNAQLDGLKGE